MRLGEIILHVCLHGTYHRGSAGIVLQKNGIAPNSDRMTDFLEPQPECRSFGSLDYSSEKWEREE